MPAAGADRLQLFQLTVRKASGFVKKPADQRRLAMIDRADNHNTDQRTIGRSDMALWRLLRDNGVHDRLDAFLV